MEYVNSDLESLSWQIHYDRRIQTFRSVLLHCCNDFCKQFLKLATLPYQNVCRIMSISHIVQVL